jgi:hypothetical protein
MARTTSTASEKNGDTAVDTALAAPAAGAPTTAGDTAQNSPGNTAASDAAAPNAVLADTAAAVVDANSVASAKVEASGNSIMIFPLRSYLDGKEVRRRGGAGYLSPKHDAISLIAAGLATDKKPKA